MKYKLLIPALAAALVLPAFAAEKNPDIVNRQGIYKIAAGHMNGIKSILFLGREAKPGDLSYHANGIVAAFEHMGNSYPAGSGEGETKADPAIWEKPEDFKQAGQKAYQAAKALAAAAEGTDKDAQIAAFKKMGGACKGCHEDFRQR